MSHHTAARWAPTWLCVASASLAFTPGGVWSAPLAASEPLTPAVSASDTSPVALMLAHNWSPGGDPAPYLVSEKLDGVRAFWDGERLRFRSGRLIAAPAWFLAALPATPLDGELWLGRGRFDEASATVRRRVPVDAEWQALRYMVFDLPAQAGSFQQRAARAQALLAQMGVPWLQAVVHTEAGSVRQLEQRLHAVVSAGGEGLMLHRASALWSPGRSEALKKLKPLPDADARVVGYAPGKGRHAGRVGALWLALPGGQRLALGSGLSDALRESPPPLGAMVTYRYRGLTPKGVPRFASFWRLAPGDE